MILPKEDHFISLTHKKEIQLLIITILLKEDHFISQMLRKLIQPPTIMIPPKEDHFTLLTHKKLTQQPITMTLLRKDHFILLVLKRETQLLITTMLSKRDLFTLLVPNKKIQQLTIMILSRRDHFTLLTLKSLKTAPTSNFSLWMVWQSNLTHIATLLDALNIFSQKIKRKTIQKITLYQTSVWITILKVLSLTLKLLKNNLVIHGNSLLRKAKSKWN